MATLKYRVSLSLCFSLIIGIFILYNSKEIPALRDYHFWSANACLKSYNARTLHRTIFHSSMVDQTAPTQLHYWVQNKTGFEIGGPSYSTWGSLGVYDAAAKLDVTNFASNTLWESGLTDGSDFVWKNKSKGLQYIRDAVDLKGILHESYDFPLASHVLQHITNPFKALLEWLRITRPRGLLLLILPFKT